MMGIAWKVDVQLAPMSTASRKRHRAGRAQRALRGHFPHAVSTSQRAGKLRCGRFIAATNPA